MKKEKPQFVGFRLYKIDRTLLARLARQSKVSRASIIRFAIHDMAEQRLPK